jgi:hypothetical protein
VPTRTPLPGDPGRNPIVRHGRNPVAISMFGMLLVSGVIGLVDPSKASPALTVALGPWVWTWHAGLVVGSAAALFAVLGLKPLNDVLIERIACVWLSSLFIAYGLIITVATGFATYTGVVLGLGLAFAARAWQITRDLQRLRRVLRDLPAREGPSDM